MTQAERARAFAALHVKGALLVLYNIWDAGSARAVVDSGAVALATGSWSVAAAQGFEDGEALPRADLLRTAAQIVSAVDLPVSVMASPATPLRADLAAFGVARISHGPFPYRAAMATLTQAAQDAGA